MNHEGIEVGAVAVKWVRFSASGELTHRVVRHNGDPRTTLADLLESTRPDGPVKRIITGASTRAYLDLPYRTETECIERTLEKEGLRPDLVLSLGGESFTVYTIKGGRIRTVSTSSKCAAGTGEFVVQQFARMGFTLEQGLAACARGTPVTLASRCSVHCKSDATHKLNVGECSREDIALSLVRDLAGKVGKMVELARWPSKIVLLTGGIVHNQPFRAALGRILSASELLTLPQSPYLEAFGAAILAADSGDELPSQGEVLPRPRPMAFSRLPPIREAESLLDYRVSAAEEALQDDRDYLLGVDAGSTTTKAVLYDPVGGVTGASCYLRTSGNPVEATRQCLLALREKSHGKPCRIVSVTVTGSGREMVSVFLDNCLAVNEILAHARAAVEEVPAVETVFEIGGQDSKFVSLLSGVPVDYAMNEGCSAGTGSFLEESAAVDMNVPFQEIGERALCGREPIAFGERCAAFINTDIRNALQQGAEKDDVLAGLVYSIADNYLSRLAGQRSLGEVLLFQGGVALNRAVALTLAMRTGRRLVVPRRPELMGAVGAALMAKDLLAQGEIQPISFSLERTRLGDDQRLPDLQVVGTLRCPACENRCEIKKIRIKEAIYPFGGLCSRFSLQRRGRQQVREGFDGIALRHELMFREYGAVEVREPRGTIGIPQALSTLELYPLYAALVNGWGYDVVLSKPSRAGSALTLSPVCYPGELLHGAVSDLLGQGVSFVFVPALLQMECHPGFEQSFLCPTTAVIPGILARAFEGQAEKILAPQIALAESLISTTLGELEALSARLDIPKRRAREAFPKALARYRAFREALREQTAQALAQVPGEPVIVLAGRPYTSSTREVNLSIPRKIVSRGYHVVPMDALAVCERSSHPRNCWHFTQQVMDAVRAVKGNRHLYLCLLSCFSCGPDACILHEIRKEMRGLPFCFLEIDSHTAHAGIETRIEAFLEIIDRQRRGA